MYETSKNTWIEHRLYTMDTSKYKVLIVSKMKFVTIEEVRAHRAKRKKEMSELATQNQSEKNDS